LNEKVNSTEYYNIELHE